MLENMILNARDLKNDESSTDCTCDFIKHCKVHRWRKETWKLVRNDREIPLMSFKDKIRVVSILTVVARAGHYRDRV